MAYLNYFFNANHLLSLRPPLLSNRALVILALIILAGCVIASACLFLARRADSLTAKAYHRYAHALFTASGLTALYTFFAAQGIVVLSGRFWLVIVAAIVLIWILQITVHLIKVIPQQRQQLMNQRQFRKYLP